MAAECAFLVKERPCGVAAVGRCLTCGWAFCQTHQGHGPAGEWVDTCMECLARDAAGSCASVPRQNGWEYIEASASNDLRAAGVPMRTVLWLSSSWERGGLLRRGQYIQRAQRRARGWLIGSFRWSYRVPGIHGDLEVEELALTFVLDGVIAQGADPQANLVRVLERPGRVLLVASGRGASAPDGVFLQSRFLDCDVESLAETIRMLAGITDSSGVC